jgi:hypothetical protein
MAKKKRSRKARSGSQKPAWSTLEETFFASAPPDEPATPLPVDSFDDLVAAVPPPRRGRVDPRRWLETLTVLAEALTAPHRRTFGIVMTALVVLVALTAVVFAAH